MQQQQRAPTVLRLLRCCCAPQVPHAGSGVACCRRNPRPDCRAAHVAGVKTLRDLLQKAEVRCDGRRERIKFLAQRQRDKETRVRKVPGIKHSTRRDKRERAQANMAPAHLAQRHRHRVLQLRAAHLEHVLELALDKTPLFFFEFSLCLSRACLGKMILFTSKWLQKGVFSHRLGAELPHQLPHLVLQLHVLQQHGELYAGRVGVVGRLGTIDVVVRVALRLLTRTGRTAQRTSANARQFGP